MPTTLIDAHQHYWQIARGDYGWMGPKVEPIRRDYFPADMKPHLDAAGVARTVVVQAAPTVAETEFLLGLADKDDTIAAVVGWVDLHASDAIATLERLASHPKFRGIRPMLQDIEDTFDILAPSCIAALERMPPLGLSFDALLQPRHLPAAAALADRLPDLAIVVDHGAKPFIASGIIEPWASDMAALAKRPNVSCKLSGLITEAGAGWSVAMLKPYCDHLIRVFGADRLMFGSDWPVLDLTADYAAWWNAAHALTSGLSEAERAAIFGGTAARFYRI